MRAIGAISGTSMDGIDVALVDTDGMTQARPGPGATYAYDPTLRHDLLRAAAVAAQLTPPQLAALEDWVTAAHVGAIAAFMATHGLRAADIEVVGLHGQTILHQPQHRRTVQLGHGAVAARELGIAVVDQFRQADVAAGGQGAPFVPLYHRALLGETPDATAVLNLGGVGNLTFLEGKLVQAFDTGPGSALLDDLVRTRRGEAFDRDGALAASGQAHADVVAAFMTDPFFARPPPKSLDRQHFHAVTSAVDGLADADAAATLAACTVASVAASRTHLPHPPTRWLVAGGGRHNRYLLARLGQALVVPVEPVEALGWDGDFLEAQAFAYLAVRALAGLPLSLPGTTGVPRPMSGGRVHRPARDGLAPI